MYIKLMIEQNKNLYISYWLLLITILVGLMIIVGGLTRLTDSGLSITKWQLFSGFLPPLNDDDWNNYFNLYKEIPEFKLQNFEMSLQDFYLLSIKVIGICISICIKKFQSLKSKTMK